MICQMSHHPEYMLSRFCVVGVSHKEAPESIRSLFSLSEEQQTLLLSEASAADIRSLMILCTCNRSEIYGYAGDERELTALYLRHIKADAAVFQQYGFVKRGEEALQYLFEVSTGLQSQITGDYEIAGQIRVAMARSRKFDLLGPIMHRTLNTALQASKAVRTQTRISTGTVSVSYAVIEWLRGVALPAQASILVVGAGSMGRSVARNIVEYMPDSPLTLVNRTIEKAMELAGELGVDFMPMEQLPDAIKKASVLVMCTQSDQFLLTAEDLKTDDKKIIIDLSVPSNVHPEIRERESVRYVGVDEVSQSLQHTLRQRQDQIEEARHILGGFVREFREWLSHYRHSLLIQDVRKKLYHLIDNNPVLSDVQAAKQRDQYVNKTIGDLAMSLRYEKEKGCAFISAINSFLGVETSNR
jgi:glutamyl-tRNA reductase